MPATPSLPHRRALDGVRGLAVLAVLMFHAGRLEGGYLGVDLFFVLSGYLITSLLLVEAASVGSVHLLAFWARRARRLLPALFLVLAFVGIFAATVADPTSLHRIRDDALAAMAYVANWRFVFTHVDYWALFTAPSPLDHTWSLAIEEQFYLVWPLVFVGVLTWGRRRGRSPDAASTARRVFFVALALAGALGALALLLWARQQDPTRIYYGTDTRAPSILLGVALAAFVTWRGPATSRMMRAGVELAGLAGAVLLAVAWARLSGVTLYRGGLLVCALGAVAVIAAAAQPHVGPLARALSFGPFVGLGLISYGVYLWHWPIYIWLDPERVGVDGWALFGIRLAVTIVVAIASFVLVEQPIRRGAFGGRTLRWATPLAAGALVVITLVSTAGYTTPVTHADVGIVDATAAAREARRHPEARRLLVVGNSVGFFLAGEGFSRLVTHPKVVTLNVAKPSCAYPDGVRLRMQDFGRGTPTFRCADGWREARLRFRPEVVLMLFSDSGASRLLHHGRWLAACDPRYGAWYRHALTRTTERFMARGARVVLTTGAYSVVFGSSDAARAETDCKNRLTRDFARSHPGVGFVDLARFVCPTRQECRDTWHGVTLRMDGTHFRGRAARLVARWLYDQLDLGSRSVAPSMPAPLP